MSILGQRFSFFKLRKTVYSLFILGVILNFSSCNQDNFQVQKNPRSFWDWEIIDPDPDLNSSVQAVAYGEGLVTLFSKKNEDNQIYGLNLNSDGEWWPLPSPWPNPSNASTSIWGENHIIVFIRSSSIQLHYKVFNLTNGLWGNWIALSGNTIFRPAVTSRGNLDLGVFAVGMDNTLQVRFYSPGKGWDPTWTNLGGFIVAEPAVVHRGGGHLSVVVHGPNNKIFIKHYDPSLLEPWSPWIQIDGLNILSSSAPAAAWRENGYLHIFARGQNQALYHLIQKFNENGKPTLTSDWEFVDTCLSKDPSAISNSPESVSLFVIKCNEKLYKITGTDFN